MKIYSLHTSPEKLYRYKDAQKIPRLKWDDLVDETSVPGYEPPPRALKKYEHLWIQDPFTAVEYATHMEMDRWPEAEPIISTDPYAALNYARWILDRPWPEGEAAIFSNAKFAIEYIKYFSIIWDVEIPKKALKKIMPEIISDPKLSLNYARHVVKGRFPEGEAVMRKSQYHWAEYGQFLYRLGYEERTENGEWNFFPRADYYKD